MCPNLVIFVDSKYHLLISSNMCLSMPGPTACLVPQHAWSQHAWSQHAWSQHAWSQHAWSQHAWSQHAWSHSMPGPSMPGHSMPGPSMSGPSNDVLDVPYLGIYARANCTLKMQKKMRQNMCCQSGVLWFPLESGIQPFMMSLFQAFNLLKHWILPQTYISHKCWGGEFLHSPCFLKWLPLPVECYCIWVIVKAAFEHVWRNFGAIDSAPTATMHL